MSDAVLLRTIARSANNLSDAARAQLLSIAEDLPESASSGSLGAMPAMEPELAWILGTMCFNCVRYADMLRRSGQEIATRAEAEQAAALHWMLEHYFRHGPAGWRAAAEQDLKDRAQRAAGIKL